MSERSSGASAGARVRRDRDRIERSRGAPSSTPVRNDRDRIETLEREVWRLEAALDRRDERLQAVIDRYEAIIENQRTEYEQRLDGAAARSNDTGWPFLGRIADRLGRT